MATREENIKKINDELEKLSDEELDNVASGGILHFPDRPRFPRPHYGAAGDNPNAEKFYDPIDIDTKRI